MIQRSKRTRAMRADPFGDRVADTHIADLILRFLNSLQLRRVCDHAETFSFILLKILPVEDLQNKHNHVGNKDKVKNYTRRITHVEWANFLNDMHFTARQSISMHLFESMRKFQQMQMIIFFNKYSDLDSPNLEMR